jgi:hypothetical protein
VGVCGTCRGGRDAGLELGSDVGATISACVRAVPACERGPRDSGTDARAHDGPKRR